MQLTPTGVIHSPYKQRGDAPRQGRLSDNEITLEIYPQFAAALKDVTRCSHLIVLYWGERANRETLQSRTPFSVDTLDGSPLLDIKAYASALDAIPQAVNGNIPANPGAISRGKMHHA